MSKSSVKSVPRRKHKSVTQADWVSMKDEQLLDMRMCDLKLSIEDSFLADMRNQLYAELAARNLRLKPHCWLSDDWFSPDGIPGIAIPFYLAHPRLIRLERRKMLEVEGGTKTWCMRILRHETGHAFDTAYRLHRKKKYKQVFGNYFSPYPESYKPKPRSKNFVLHLEPWYAQSHPSEDFAETFAVWLKRGSGWKQKYKGWQALKKVELVDEMMNQISGAAAKVKSRAKIEPLHRIKKTLRQHYAERHAAYAVGEPSIFDEDLKKLFPQTPETRPTQSAAAFLRKNRQDLCATVAQWTGEYRYNTNQVLREMIDRCRTLNLRLSENDESQLRQNLMIVLTVHTMNNLHGVHRVAL